MTPLETRKNRPSIDRKTERAIRAALTQGGKGMLKIPSEHGQWYGRVGQARYGGRACLKTLPRSGLAGVSNVRIY
jgi:hypothetical protein